MLALQHQPPLQQQQQQQLGRQDLLWAQGKVSWTHSRACCMQ
jgi:hypothetical protein